MKHFLLYLSLLLSLLLTTGCTTLSSSEIRIKTGETAAIELEANWSTGYQWHLRNMDKLSYVENTGRDYGSEQTEEEEEISGAPGMEIWTFTGINPGKEILDFQYKRSVDDRTAEKKKKIIIIVE